MLQEIAEQMLKSLYKSNEVMLSDERKRRLKWDDVSNKMIINKELLYLQQLYQNRWQPT